MNFNLGLLPNPAQAGGRRLANIDDHSLRTELPMHLCKCFTGRCRNNGNKFHGPLFGQNSQELSLGWTWNGTYRLNLDSRWEFLVSKESDFGEIRGKKAPQPKPDGRRTEDNRRSPLGDHGLHQF